MPAETIALITGGEMNAYRGPPMTLGNAALGQVRSRPEASRSGRKPGNTTILAGRHHLACPAGDNCA
jgi:hypothetical protein